MEVVPSPKFQIAPTPAGVEVFANTDGVPAQIFKGVVKFALTVPITTVFGLIKVSEQPARFVVISLTVKLPALA